MGHPDISWRYELTSQLGSIWKLSLLSSNSPQIADIYFRQSGLDLFLQPSLKGSVQTNIDVAPRLTDQFFPRHQREKMKTNVFFMSEQLESEKKRFLKSSYT
jgi:hypothetical protein